MSIILAILVIGLVILIHELGHFILAKKNGITVTEFSIGMGPRLVSFVKNGTRYSIKLLPLGGSCMMLGEDESINDEGAFNNKGVWARFSVLFAGAFFNFILAFVLALVVIGIDGIDQSFINGIETASPAEEAGLMKGDLITGINGTKVKLGRELFYHFYFNPVTDEPIEITYERDGAVSKALIKPRIKDTYMLGFDYSRDNAEVLKVVEGYPFAEAGVVVGDVIVKINDIPLTNGADLSTYIGANPLTNEPVTVTYLREGQEYTIEVTPKLYSSEYYTGMDYNLYYQKIPVLSTIKFSFYELKFNIKHTVRTLGYLITGKIGLNQVSGPVGIVNVVDNIVEVTKGYGIKVTLLELASFCILLSANLGVMNLIPFPALDGGRLVFLLIEAVRGKPISKDKEAMVHLIGI